jgi:hypothetical protein
MFLTLHQDFGSNNFIFALREVVLVMKKVGVVVMVVKVKNVFHYDHYNQYNHYNHYHH